MTREEINRNALRLYRCLFVSRKLQERANFLPAYARSAIYFRVCDNDRRISNVRAKLPHGPQGYDPRIIARYEAK